MRPVGRDEILDYVTYAERREEVRRSAIETKRRRRVHVGPHLTFLFENSETVRYQVQEMVRVEQLVRESDIQHELATYNELLGGPGELGCTLLIEIDEPGKRAALLAAWRDLPGHLYAVLPGGARVRPSFDERQIGEDRLSAVQFLKFAVGGQAPVALGTDHPEALIEAALSEEQRAALLEDLASA